MTDYAEYFAIEKNVFFELGQARGAFNNKTTEEQFDNLIKGLGLMYLYCPEDIQYCVKATLDEAIARQNHLVGLNLNLEVVES